MRINFINLCALDGLTIPNTNGSKPLRRYKKQTKSAQEGKVQRAAKPESPQRNNLKLGHLT